MSLPFGVVKIMHRSADTIAGTSHSFTREWHECWAKFKFGVTEF